MFNRQQILGTVLTIAAAVAAMVLLAALDVHQQIAGTIVLLVAVFGVAVASNLGVDGRES